MSKREGGINDMQPQSPGSTIRKKASGSTYFHPGSEDICTYAGMWYFNLGPNPEATGLR
jgi:hypothetical protein